MRKLIYLMIPFLVIVLSFKSYAYNAPAGGDYKYYYTFTTPETSSTYASTYELWSDAKFGLVNISGSYYLSTLLKDTNGNYKVTTFSGNGNYKLPYVSANSGYSPSNFGTPDYGMIKQPQARLTIRGSSAPISNGTVLVVPSSQLSYPNNVGIQTYNSFQTEYEALYNDYLNGLYDWDNPFYSVAIPAPEYEVTYRKLVYDSPDVPLNFTINIADNSDLYCEVMADFTLPSNLKYREDPTKYFEVLQTTSFQKIIVNKQELVLAQNVTASSLYTILTNKFSECLRDFPLSSVSITFPTYYDLTAQEILDLRASYDSLRQNATFAGNEVKFYIRYFTIENGSQFVVGPWRIWSSASPKTFNDKLPDWYKPYIPASGNTGTNTTTESDSDVVVINPYEETPTGEYYSPSINIQVGSNVPNYPDYPTIASYNMDNLLVNTMNNAKGLTSFFGEFGDFLTTSFAFFPAWIWAIIGVGFGISIVVMFLKIL